MEPRFSHCLDVLLNVCGFMPQRLLEGSIAFVLVQNSELFAKKVHEWLLNNLKFNWNKTIKNTKEGESKESGFKCPQHR